MVQYPGEITYENELTTFLPRDVILECFDENPSHNLPNLFETNLPTLEKRKVNVEEESNGEKKSVK
jgi:hypothetical protein